MNNKLRLIARLDIKGENLIKGIHLEGLRVIGSPLEFAKRYYEQGADEIIFMDSVASLYGRNSLIEIIKQTTKDVFVPIIVGGGIRSHTDAVRVLRAGADKVAINTAAIKNPDLITEIANSFGRQCMVLSVEAKKINTNSWEAYTDNGREPTGIDVISWIKEATKRGAGEILITSIDKDGTYKGFENDLLRSITKEVSVPVIASGGMGKMTDLLEAYKSGCDGLAMASVLHYEKTTINEIRQYILKQGIQTRNYV